MKEYKLRMKKYFKEKLKHSDLLILGKIYLTIKGIFWPITNFIRIQNLKTKKNLMFHFGCGEKELPGFINVDTRVTVAADITMDLNHPRFKKGSAKCCFSHAFFEHLYMLKRVEHLKCVHEILNDDGFICYIGIPYFKNIAKFYLEKAPGVIGPVFNLYEVYRYTHGLPEMVSKKGWLGQLHKALFDEDEISKLLDESGFKSYVIFEYVFPFDEHPLAVNCGFYATKKVVDEKTLKDQTTKFLSQFSDQFVLISSIKFINKI